MTVAVDRPWFVEVEHGALGAPMRSEQATGLLVPLPTHSDLAATSGTCTASARLAAAFDQADRPVVFAAVDCSLLASHNGNPARGTSGGELLLTLQSPQPRRGTLRLTIDTRGSYGPTTLGEMFVDIGDDGIGEFAGGGQAPSVVEREFPVTVTPAGLRVRLVHMGLAIGDDTQDCVYHASVHAFFVPDVSPITPYLPGAAPLTLLRSIAGHAMFFFDAPQPGELRCLCVGEPVPPAAIVPWPLPFLHGSQHLIITATTVVPGPVYVFPPRLLRPIGQACVQGFVFRPDGLWATDSWVVN